MALKQNSPLTKAPNFRLLNQENIAHNISQIMGESGLFLVFTGDVWDMACIRNVLWLQRQVYKLSTYGLNIAVIVPNQTYDLSGFFISIPRKMPFPMLADPDSKTYSDYDIEKTGFVVIDNQQNIRGKWKLKSGAVPHMRDILKAIAE